MKHTDSTYQEDLLQLSSTLSKLLKRRFGKGPETCFVNFHSNRLIVFVRNYITPSEEVLIKSDKMSLAYNFRSAVMGTVFKEFAQEASSILNVTFDSFYGDWDYDTNTGILLLGNENNDNWSNKATELHINRRLFEQIVKVGSEVHKAPNRLELIRVNQSIYVVECNGIMLQIEKVLFEKGHFDILQERSREIKKSYVQHKEVFSQIVGRRIDGFYMIWDYKTDRCYVILHVVD
jgi:uncharacterized protein YbcI